MKRYKEYFVWYEEGHDDLDETWRLLGVFLNEEDAQKCRDLQVEMCKLFFKGAEEELKVIKKENTIYVGTEKPYCQVAIKERWV